MTHYRFLSHVSDGPGNIEVVRSPCLSVLALAVALGGATPAQGADAIVVIVNPSVAGAAIRRSDLAAVFLRKVVRWGDRSEATPVDQSGASLVRHAFSEAVLQMPSATVLQYWQKQMFASPPLRPPAVKPNDGEVIAFVAKTTGAVGYVSAGAALPAGVKVLQVVD